MESLFNLGIEYFFNDFNHNRHAPEEPLLLFQQKTFYNVRI